MRMRGPRPTFDDRTMNTDEHTHTHEPGERGIPLISCRDCGSNLLQLSRIWLLVDGRHAAERRCPQCGRHDLVQADPRALSIWAKRERRLLETLEDLAAAMSGRESPESVPPAS